MANITIILGTDSVSSSRIVLNNNFSAINDELSEISQLLDVQTQTLSITGNVNSRRIKTNNGSSDTFNVTDTNITLSLDSKFDKNVEFAGAIRYSTTGTLLSPVSVLPNPNSWLHSMYLIDATILTGIQTLNPGNQGQEVTLSPIGGTLELDNSVLSGEATSLVIADGKTVTLRYIDTLWFVISRN